MATAKIRQTQIMNSVKNEILYGSESRSRTSVDAMEWGLVHGMEWEPQNGVSIGL